MKRSFLVVIFVISILGNLTLAQDLGVQDTCIVERLEYVPAGTQVVLNVYLVNDHNIGGFGMGLGFPDSATNLDITCDSISWVGTRGASATYRSDATSVDNGKNRLTLYGLWFVGYLAPGDRASGPLAKIYFTTGPSWDPNQFVPVDTTLWPPNPNSYEFTDSLGKAFFPVFLKGALEVKEVSTPNTPRVFSLSQNYPNPFNPKTIIRFGLPKDSWVKLEVYNVLGQKVKTLVDEKLTPGLKEVEWDGVNDKGFEVASGIYFYKISADDFSDIKKMVMLK